MARAFAETLLALLVTLALTVLFRALLELANGSDASTAFLEDAPRMVFEFLWPALLIWTVLILVGNLRNRSRSSGTKFLTGVMATIAASVVASLGWLIFAMIAGGWYLLVFAYSLVPTAFFLVAAILALLLTHRGIFRRSPSSA